MAKIRSNPRISVNKLAEYMVATPGRRKTIIKDAKNPPDNIVTMYKEVRELIASYILGNKTKKQIEDQIKTLKAKAPRSIFDGNKNKASAAALEALLQLDLSILRSLDLEEYKARNKKLHINGVDISIDPDIIVSKNKKGAISIGVLKLHIIQSNALNQEAQNYVGVMLQMFSEKFMEDVATSASNKMSFSVDVFKGRIVLAPPSYKQKLAHIEAACEEIALRWPTV